MQPAPLNHHCTCVKIGSVALMLEGPSGAGKTSVALGLLQVAAQQNLEHGLICDDQALIEVKNQTLWATAPPAIAGKVELYGFGIMETENLGRCKIDLVCELIDRQNITRLPSPQICERFDIKIDYIQLPMQHESQCVRIVLAKLGIPFLPPAMPPIIMNKEQISS